MRKFKVLGLLSMPLLAIAIAVVAFGWSSGTEKASAATPGTLFSINVNGTACDTATTDEKCNLSMGQNFVINVSLDALGTAPDYAGYDTFITYAGVDSKDNASSAAWTACGFPAAIYGAGTARFGCASGISVPNSTQTGTIGTLSFNCVASGTIDLVHGTTNTALDGTYFDKAAGTDGQETLTINCLVPTDTPPNTATFTPTNTPTNTPTSTPPPVPRWMKLQRYPFTDATSQCELPGDPPAPNCTEPQDPSKDNLGNLWLTRQGAKIPPLNCQTGTNNAVFSEVLQFTPQVPDPKGVHPFAFIGGFEFEVRFDQKAICVNLVPGQAVADLGLICFVDDKDEGQPLEGIARMGCVTKGKNKEFPSEFKTGGPELAQIWVQPQPELYSINRPNQDNGVVTQLLDQNCELADEQGHPIPLFSCEDASITIRYLEGDVEPDCQVDALDQQNVAFRWGANQGSLLYNSRFDLEPSGTVKGDFDIDIKDLQFVFGRFGSSCGRTVDHDLAPVLKPLPADCIQGDPCLGPHPRQEPRNPNA